MRVCLHFRIGQYSPDYAALSHNHLSFTYLQLEASGKPPSLPLSLSQWDSDRGKIKCDSAYPKLPSPQCSPFEAAASGLTTSSRAPPTISSREKDPSTSIEMGYGNPSLHLLSPAGLSNQFFPLPQQSVLNSLEPYRFVK